VNCEWTEWFVEKCTATCGTAATRKKTRKIKVLAANGGDECNGKDQIQEPCKLHNCRGKFRNHQ
jgi:hypothetical protein